jgi:ABC-type dipeptide/oligopeptide/nickel transport system permease subunit
LTVLAQPEPRAPRRALPLNGLVLTGIVLVGAIVSIGLLGPLLSPHDIFAQNIANASQGPSAAHWFGTDDLGRDVLTRIVFGTRTALFTAAGVTVLAVAIGTIVGTAAGYFGGRVDALLMWFTDVVMSVPTLLLVVVMNTSFRPPLAMLMDRLYLATLNPVFREAVWSDLFLLLVCLALAQWPAYARLVRGQVRSVREQNYVRAARSVGLSPTQIMRRYILPNAVGPIIVAASAGIGTAMVLESAFSFLGVGIQPPIPSWGLMIADGLRSWRAHPHLLVLPALALAVASVGFSLVGDGLNRAMNPRRKSR